MELRNKIIYQLFLTDFTEEGTFEAAKKRLPYLQSLGIDIIQLMPFYLLGEKGKKGAIGSPYCIKDYETIDPRLGNENDCRSFIDKAHELGIKVIFDVVFHHTSRDCPLLETHPDWYFHKDDGSFGNQVGDWDDIYDLDLKNPELLSYLLSVLRTYVDWGADGFRFDVASLINPALFQAMREMLDPLKKDMIYLGESVDASFCNYLRSLGADAYSNEELYEAGLDLLYHYASWENLKKFLSSKNTLYLECYKVALRMEEAGKRNDGLLVRAIENHDNRRIASYSDDIHFTKSLLAYSFFAKGPAFLYNGEEYGEKHMPDFFQKETLPFAPVNEEIATFIHKLIALKHNTFFPSLNTSLPLDYEGKVLVVENRLINQDRIIGIFNFSEEETLFIPHQSECGIYYDLLHDETITLSEAGIKIRDPLWLKKM